MLMRPARWILLTALAALSFTIPPRLGGQPGNATAFDANASDSANSSPRRFVLDRGGLLLATSDRSTTMRVHGYLQGDARLFATDLAGQAHEVFLFRRVRPLVEGTLGGTFAYKFMPDFGQGNPVVQEVYAETTGLPAAALRAGKFKTPIGLEALRPDRALTFPERSLVSDLVPLRELGAQVEGSFLDEAATFELGFFDGTQDGQNSAFAWSGSNEAVARLFVEPIALLGGARITDLGAGLAASAGHDHNELPGFKTVGQQAFFRYRSGASAQGQHDRLSPQAMFFHGPLGVMAEYAISVEPARLASESRELHNKAWEIAGSYFLTRDTNAYGIFEPPHSFSPAHPLRQHGSWEIALRHSEARMDPNSFPLFADPAKSARLAEETGAGLNWYLNRVAKLMAFYEYTGFSRGEAGVKALEPERLAALRLQLAF